MVIVFLNHLIFKVIFLHFFLDLFIDIINSKNFSNFCTFTSRKSNIDIIMTSQNLFQKGPFSTTIRRQLTHLVVWYQKAEKQLLSHISRNYFPTRSTTIIDAFKKLLDYGFEPYENYVLMDLSLHSKLSEDLMIRSRIFHKEPLFFCL